MSNAFDDLFGPPPRYPWQNIPARDRPLDPNSALLWEPAIYGQISGLRFPKTEAVRIDPDAAWAEIGLMDESELPDDCPLPPSAWAAQEDDGESISSPEATSALPWAAFEAAAARVGYPCFVRSDLKSAKHEGPAGYRVDGPGDLQRVVRRVLVRNAEYGLLDGPAPLRALLFRQWIELDGRFTAFHGHPIAPEWRFFADAEGYLCAHFYWPVGAITTSGSLPADPDWRRILNRMETEGVVCTRVLDAIEAAQKASAALAAVERPAWMRAPRDPSAWSVDFARDREGAWWLIDMALAEESWHPDDCSLHRRQRERQERRARRAGGA